MARFESTTQVLHLWEETVGDSGQAPTDDELVDFARAVEARVREDIALELRAEAASLLGQSVAYYSGQARIWRRAADRVEGKD